MIHQSKDLTVVSSRAKYPGRWSGAPEGDVREGVVVEGVVRQVRNHTVEDSAAQRTRYVALVVELSSIRLRTWNSKGEVRPERGAGVHQQKLTPIKGGGESA